MLAADKLAAGTVQWGMPYGIANSTGVPSESMVAEILRSMATAGVSLLDTAWAYGEAESLLGRLRVADAGFGIVTKTRSIRSLIGDSGVIADQVETAFRSSLKKLRTTSVYGLLVHGAADLLGPSGNALWTTLERLRADGLTGKLGCSVYSPSQLEQLLERFPLQIVQIPFNVYDQRLTVSGIATKLRQAKMEVHVRSAFLQGVLLAPPDSLPPKLAGLRDIHIRWHSACRNQGVTPLQASLHFCLESNDVDKVVVGCEHLAQWQEIYAALTCAKPATWDRHHFEELAVADEALIDPSMWRR